MNWILREVVTKSGGVLKVEYSVNRGVLLSYGDKTPLGMDIHNTQYADDLTLIAESRHEIQNMLDVLDRCCRKWGGTINCCKTKLIWLLENSPRTTYQFVQIVNHLKKSVVLSIYLGSILESTCSVDRDRRGQQTTDNGYCVSDVKTRTKYLEVVTSALQPRYGYSNHWWCQSFSMVRRPGV